MAVESLSNPRENLPNVYTNVTAREIDFVSRFTQNWEALRDILGIMRPIQKAPGTKLKSYKTSVSLASGSVEPGNVIPYSKSTIEQVAYSDLVIEKYAKAVPIEDVDKYGAAVAIEKSDEAFLNELQTKVLTSFYTFLNTGSLTSAEPGFQKALAMAKANVLNKFQQMRKTVTEVVGFANILDFYSYLGDATISVQTMFGITYVQNFLGYRTLFLLSAPDIPQGKVIATPVENIDLYYIDPSDSDFRRLGLEYTVEGETNLIGFHANGNYSTAVGESFALMGMTLWAEYLDGIAVVSIDDSFLTDLTVAADSPSQTFPWTDKKPSDFQSGITVNGGEITGTLDFIEGGLSPSGPLAGDGYFLALKFSNFSSGLTYANVKVGLEPSMGTGLVTLDSDCDVVMKIADKNTQKVKVIQSDSAGHKNIQYFGLKGLTLETAAEA